MSPSRAAVLRLKSVSRPLLTEFAWHCRRNEQQRRSCGAQGTESREGLRSGEEPEGGRSHPTRGHQHPGALSLLGDVQHGQGSHTEPLRHVEDSRGLLRWRGGFPARDKQIMPRVTFPLQIKYFSKHTRIQIDNGKRCHSHNYYTLVIVFSNV